MNPQFKTLMLYFKDDGIETGLKESFSYITSSLMGKLTIASAAITATYKAIDYINSGWTRAGEAAENATSEFESANSELESLKSQKINQQEQVQEIAAKYNIDTTLLDFHFSFLYVAFLGETFDCNW